LRFVAAASVVASICRRPNRIVGAATSRQTLREARHRVTPLRFFVFVLVFVLVFVFFFFSLQKAT
jgi:hypothetical protein